MIHDETSERALRIEEENVMVILREVCSTRSYDQRGAQYEGALRPWYATSASGCVQILIPAPHEQP